MNSSTYRNLSGTTRRGAWVGRATPEHAAVDAPAKLTPEQITAHRDICLACQFLSPETENDSPRLCLHKNCGCWRSDARKNPWEKLTKCAAGNF